MRFFQVQILSFSVLLFKKKMTKTVYLDFLFAWFVSIHITNSIPLLWPLNSKTISPNRFYSYLLLVIFLSVYLDFLFKMIHSGLLEFLLIHFSARLPFIWSQFSQPGLNPVKATIKCFYTYSVLACTAIYLWNICDMAAA